MDTRLLYMIALCIAVLSGLFYFYSGKSANLEANNNQNFSFVANNVNLLKTDESGALSMKTDAKHLQQWVDTNKSELNVLQSVWYQQGHAYATFKADKAFGFNNNEKIILSGNIIGQRLPTNDQPLMTFTTTTLTGYPKQHRVETDQPILIQSPQGKFTSQGFNADLTAGDFNLFHIRGQYFPVRRAH